MFVIANKAPPRSHPSNKLGCIGMPTVEIHDPVKPVENHQGGGGGGNRKKGGVWVRTVPTNGKRKPAPTLALMSRIGTTNPVGTPFLSAS